MMPIRFLFLLFFLVSCNGGATAYSWDDAGKTRALETFAGIRTTCAGSGHCLEVAMTSALDAAERARPVVSTEQREVHSYLRERIQECQRLPVGRPTCLGEVANFFQSWRSRSARQETERTCGLSMVESDRTEQQAIKKGRNSK